jgi:hypothetical protein
MGSAGPMSHSQGLSNNPYPELNKPNSSILATLPAHLNLLDLVILNIAY